MQVSFDNQVSFDKYLTTGAYHWAESSPLNWRYNAPLIARCVDLQNEAKSLNFINKPPKNLDASSHGAGKHRMTCGNSREPRLVASRVESRITATC